MRHAAGMQRRGAAGEARHREIEAAPEEMHGTAFADKPRAETLQDALRLHQRPPEKPRRVRIVRAYRGVLVERFWVGHLVRDAIDLYGDAEGLERVAKFGIKAGNALR